MSESMIERVSKAIRRRRIDLVGNTPAPMDMIDIDPYDMALARAAIEAMREPTPEMKSAMEPWTRVSGHQDGVWKSGIDAALK